MALFNRQVELIVGDENQDGIVIRDLRMVFNGKASHSKSPNEATISIYNLARENRNRIKPNMVAQLSAGYLGQISPIITGDVTRVENYLDGVDRVTEITVTDSLVALRDSKTSLSFPPGTSGAAVLEAVGMNFGLPVRKNVVGDDKQLRGGFAFNGRTRNALTEICDFLGLEWSAQQGEIQIINKGGVFNKEGVVLSPQTGLIGSPKPKARTIADKKAGKLGIKAGQDGVRRYTKTDPNAKVKERQMFEIQGYNVRALMNAAIYPGAFVQVISDGIDGEWFRVESCTYNGDTHGSDFVVEAELVYPSEIAQK